MDRTRLNELITVWIFICEFSLHCYDSQWSFRILRILPNSVRMEPIKKKAYVIYFVYFAALQINQLLVINLTIEGNAYNTSYQIMFLRFWLIFSKLFIMKVLHKSWCGKKVILLMQIILISITVVINITKYLTKQAFSKVVDGLKVVPTFHYYKYHRWQFLGKKYYFVVLS